MTVYDLSRILDECPDEAVVLVDKGYTQVDVTHATLYRTWDETDNVSKLLLMING